MSLTNTSSSITEPVTAAELQEHGRINGEASYLAAIISAARGVAEQETGLIIPEQTFTWVIDELKDGMELPVYKVSSIDSFTYVDTSGVTQTIAADQYQIVDKNLRQKLYHVDAWPALQASKYNRVTINMTAGQTVFNSNLKQAIMMIALGMFENREDQVIGTIAASISLSSKVLLSNYKRFSV